MVVDHGGRGGYTLPRFSYPWYNSVMANQFTTSWPERFWEKVNKTEECWLWSASKDSCGYGIIRYNGKNWRSHRVSYEMEFGVFDHFLRVLHSCDIPSCVRPSHLFLGTQSENMQDMVKKMRHGAGQSLLPSYDQFSTLPKKRKVKDICRNGHRYSEESTRIKIIKDRLIRVCRICQKNADKKDPVAYKVKGFVRGVENRKTIIDGLIDKIYSNGVRCWYCGGHFECLDHELPKYLGGEISVENINPCCNTCNQKRKSLYV